MLVRVCGVRGSTPAPGIEFVRYGGHTSCVALVHDGARAPALVLDAGAGLRAVTRMLDGAPFTGTILLTHLHWDHTLELPFFAAGDRTDAAPTVLLPEQPGGDDAAALLAHVMSPPYFPIEPTELRGRWTFATLEPGEHEIEGFGVAAREVPHKGGRTFGYRISDGRATLAYIPDHCPTVLGPGEHGFGEYHEAALELARDADLLVHDAQLFPEELAAEADFGHSVADYAVELAARAGARAVALFHHRFDRDDDALDALAHRLGRPAGAGGRAPAVSVAAEGTDVQL
ncbi:MAG TPA: MBL fold metallo-hydrolase [Solirubrobacteraceae bacterium]|nr:MBL fold metallo-hydrolase [Solirubrobacteraceae bacterium]